MEKFRIDLGVVEYDVQIADDIFQNLDKHISELKRGGSTVFIVDSLIMERYFSDGSLMRSNLDWYFYKLPGKKNNKSFYSAMKVFEFLEAKNISRDATIVAIGGGVVGDLAGFVASCWYRGVDLIHIPTTLLSAVDSCLGGKTAINFRKTVNAVGSYHHPRAILIDTKVLSELPNREISSGFGEIVKYAMLGCSEILDVLLDDTRNFSNSASDLIRLSLKEKEKFVRGDVREASNRLFLNFGHTVGHAIEFSTIFNGEESLRHGEGVALGMIAVFRAAIKLGHLSGNDLRLLKELLKKFELPISFCAKDLGVPRELLAEKVTDLCFKDKKRTRSDLRLILLDGIGNPFIYETSDIDLMKEAVMEVIV